MLFCAFNNFLESYGIDLLSKSTIDFFMYIKWTYIVSAQVMSFRTKKRFKIFLNINRPFYCDVILIAWVKIILVFPTRQSLAF